jgi:hypothetical protein
MDLRDELIRPISGSPKDAFDRLSFAYQKWQLNQLTLAPTDLNEADLGGAKLIQADLLAPVVRSVERLTEPPDRFN